MKTDIESHNSKIGTTSRHFLLPSGSQLLLYFLISILLILTFNISRIWHYLNNVVLIPEGGLDSIIATHAPGIHKVLNSLSQSIILQVLFWLAVGCIIYIAIWFIKNIFTNIRNDMVAGGYMHPSSYDSSKYWGSVIARKIFFWVIWVTLLAQIVSGLRLVTYLANLCYIMIVNFNLVHSSVAILEALLSVTGLIYVLVLLIHLAVNSWQLIYKDL